MSLPLVALFIAAFAFGTTEFVIAGVLPQVAAGLEISIPTAGYLVSAYALGIAIGNALGWRATFWAMFALGVVSTIAMLALLPRSNGAAVRPAGFLREVRV